MAALVCTDERYLKAEGLSLANIKGCVPIDGDSHDLPMHMKANAGKKVAATDRARFGAENLQKDLSPVMHVARGKNIPPFLILHIVDPDHPETQAQAERLARVLRDHRRTHAGEVRARAVTGRVAESLHRLSP